MATERSFDSDRFRGGRAFTLIEVLVVVAIIALLVSILLPSLSAAREQARSVACSANLGQIAKAENIYQTQNKEWIPGSPLTTGYCWLLNGSTAYAPTTPGFNRLSVQMFDYVTPLRALMYGPKSIAVPANGDWSGTQRNIWVTMFEGVFKCPSNPERYIPYNATGFPYIQSSSYLTMGSIVRGGPDLYGKVPGAAVGGNYYAQGSSWEVAAPTGYRPRHSRLIRESMKVFLAEGFRYYDNGTGDKDYDPSTAGLFSSFTASNPPALGGPYAREYGKSRKFSYRHRQANAINAAFFDGHCEQLTVDFKGLGETDVGYGGTVVDAKRWYPTGSSVNIPAVLHRPPSKGTGVATLP